MPTTESHPLSRPASDGHTPTYQRPEDTGRSTLPEAHEAAERLRRIAERARFTTNLRRLADWLDANPKAPLPSDARIFVPLPTNSDLYEFAALHHLLVVHDEEGNASVDVAFGRIGYRAYSYVDFDASCDRADHRTAQRYAKRHGLILAHVERDQVEGSEER